MSEEIKNLGGLEYRMSQQDKGPELGVTSSSYKADITVLDAAPWEEQTAVDELIGLQREVFSAEIAQQHGRRGALAMRMANIERSLGNRSEAAAYTEEAVTAFRAADQPADAIAAQCVLAKEYQLLHSPDLAVSVLQQAFADRIDLSSTDGAPGLEPDERVIDRQVKPVWTALNEVFEMYLSGRLGHKAARPSQPVMESLFGQLDDMMHLPVFASSEDLGLALSGVSGLYFYMGQRRFGLPAAERRESKARAKAAGRVSFRLLIPSGVYYRTRADGSPLTLHDALAPNFNQATKHMRRWPA